MTLGQQINNLRKKGNSPSGPSQTEETSDDIIDRHELDKIKPSIEVVIRIADAPEVSVDYLVGKTGLELDSSTLNRIQEVIKPPTAGVHGAGCASTGLQS